MNRRPPLLGYNHNVRHDGRLFHVQTEDSGAQRPYLTTHVFYSGRILATTKSTYSPDDLDVVVQRLMQAQHKAVLKQLRDGDFDEKLRAFLQTHPDPQAPEAANAVPEEAPAETSLIRRLGLERLDAPGAMVVTTEPYNPIMPDFAQTSTRPRGMPALIDADIAELAGLADGIGPALTDEEVESPVVEMEAEPPSEEEILAVAAATTPDGQAVAQAVPAVSPPSSKWTPQRAGTGASRRSVTVAQGGVVIVRPYTVAGRPPGKPAAEPPPLDDLPAEQTQVRLGPPLLGSASPRSRPLAGRRSAPSTFRPQPTAEGVVVQRPMIITEKAGPGRSAEPRRSLLPPQAAQPVPPSRPGTDPKVPLALDERSLDQVILAYLAEDLNNKK